MNDTDIPTTIGALFVTKSGSVSVHRVVETPEGQYGPTSETLGVFVKLEHAEFFMEALRHPMSSATVGQPLPTRTQPGEVEANIARNILAAASSVTVSDPEAGPRDRFNALAEKLRQKDFARGDVLKALRDVFYEGRREGEQAAKETWGEAIEETDKQRAFRVAETLFGDGLISGDRAAVEHRFVEALAESRALGMRELGPRGYELRWKDNGTTTFDEELERHRTQVEFQINQSLHGGMRSNRDLLAEAVFFLLALAHQPEPGGVVEVGGSSPAHQYEKAVLAAHASDPSLAYRAQHFKTLLKRCEHGLSETLEKRRASVPDPQGAERLLLDIRQALHGHARGDK